MSPNDRERERAKRRYEKQQAARQRHEAEARRNRQVVAIVLACCWWWADRRDQPGHARHLRHPHGRATPATAARPPVQGCSTPPAVPGARTATLPPKATAAGKTYVATVTTSCGDITMELDGARAPQTVASFLGLARERLLERPPLPPPVTSGIYVLQCGDPTGTGSGGPGYGFGVENAPEDGQYPRGTLAMARTADPNSNGGQFFIVYKQTTLQDPTGYSIFGRVTGGMDIVDKIAAAGAKPADQGGNTAPNQPISILKVAVTEKKA